MKRALLGLGAVAIAAGAPTYAHHSFSAHYFEDQMISIEAKVIEFEYRNPHAWLHVAVQDERGQAQRVAGEWGSPNRLRRDGVMPDTLKPGDLLRIDGSPGRISAERKLHVKGIVRLTDGWSWRR